MVLKAREGVLGAFVVLMGLVVGCKEGRWSANSVSSADNTTSTVTNTTLVPRVPESVIPTPEPVFEGARAMEVVGDQMAFGPRPTGSEASTKAGDYILSKLSGYGWQTEIQEFDYRDTSARNLVGKAGDPQGPVFLLGAHYDTRREADQDALFPRAFVPGANDGASGVAVLLELARALDLSRVHGQVWLVFFDAEDNGRIDGWEWIVGSTRFAEQLDVNPEYVIVVDMVGDSQQDIYLEGNSDPILQGHLWNIAASLGYRDFFIPEVRHTIIDDHIPFRQRGIPSVDIIDFEYPYWHTTSDTEDKLSPMSLERVGRVLEVFLESGGDYPSVVGP